MVTIVPKKVSQKKDTKREIYARICYYYPQYTLQHAEQLPARDLSLLLRTVKKIEAKKMFDLVQITAAPHTKKGSGVKRLSEYFKGETK